MKNESSQKNLTEMDQESQNKEAVIDRKPQDHTAGVVSANIFAGHALITNYVLMQQNPSLRQHNSDVNQIFAKKRNQPMKSRVSKTPKHLTFE